MADVSVDGAARRIELFLKNGEWLAWIGSGLSFGLSYPSWTATIKELCTRCGIPFVEPEEGQASEYYMDVAQACKNRNSSRYVATLRALFTKENVMNRNATHILMHLPLKGFITTNWDPLLDSASGIHFHGQGRIISYPSTLHMDLFSDAYPPIIHIHGSVANTSQYPIVCSRDEYEEAYDYQKSSLLGFLQQSLLKYNILFIGCSLDEPYMKKVFESIHNIVRSSVTQPLGVYLPQRCILLPTRSPVGAKRTGRISRASAEDLAFEARIGAEQATYDEDNTFDLLGIKSIRYPSSSSHHHLDAVLTRLVETLSPPGRSVFDLQNQRDPQL